MAITTAHSTFIRHKTPTAKQKLHCLAFTACRTTTEATSYGFGGPDMQDDINVAVL